jgi:hypothetical protein
MKPSQLASLLFFFFLTGCALPAGTPSRPLATLAPDPSPDILIEPTIDFTLAQTATATAETLPTETPTLPPIDPTYLNFPTDTPTPFPTPIPSDFLIHFQEPGPQSKVISPIKLVAYIYKTYVGVTRVELFGEDGRLMYRKVLRTYPYVGVPTRLEVDVPYELRGAAESARLQVSTTDEFGRVQALYSVPLLLLSLGTPEINPVNEPRERIALAEPKNGQEISGGTIVVDGEMLPFNTAPVVIELVDEQGKVLASRVLFFLPPGETYQAFSTTVPYQIYARTPVRLIIHQEDQRIPGTIYIFSRELILNP